MANLEAPVGVEVAVFEVDDEGDKILGDNDPNPLAFPKLSNKGFSGRGGLAFGGGKKGLVVDPSFDW